MEFNKHIKITGTSTISWKDATIRAINEVSKTIDYITNIHVLDQRADIENNKIVKYYIDLELTFIVDINRKSNIV